MNVKSGALKWLLYAILGLCFLVLPRVEELPFSKRTATELSTVSAWLSEKLINGVGIPVNRIGTRLQSANATPAFKLECRDGGWILRQFYLLVPLAVLLRLVFKRSLPKLLFFGFIATVFGISVRALMLGCNAAFMDQNMAAGSLDTCIRMVCVLFVILVMLQVSTPSAKTCEKQADTPA